MVRPQFVSSLLIPAALAAGALLALPVAAAATTTVSQSGNTLLIVGDDAPSSLAHDPFYTNFQVQDNLGGSVIPGPGCAAVSPTSVACSAFAAGDTYGKNYAISAALGGGDDAYKYAIFDGPQTVDGGAGNDAIEVSNGNDTVQGGPGDDNLSGQLGDDTLDGGIGNDTVEGSAGNDVLTGGPGADKLLGDASSFYEDGNDTIYARDGEGDSVTCGGGADRAQIDAIDVTSGCEAVDAPAAAQASGTAGMPPTTGPVAAKLALAAKVTTKQTPSALARGKKLSVKLTADRTCQGKVALAVTKREAKRLKLGAKALTLGTSKLTTVAAATPTKLTVGVSSKYRSKLKRATKVKLSVVIACAAGPTDTFTGAVGLIAKK